MNRKVVSIGLATLLGLVLVGAFAYARLKPNKVLAESTNTPKVQDKSVQAFKEINKNFNFPLGTSNQQYSYQINSAEKRSEIIVQGKKATAIDGKVFLILNIKITNPLEQAIKIMSRDFIRLSVNGNTQEWLAPDIHNDPVEVQPISTKNTRLGFPINTTDTNLVLQVGTVNGQKEQIPLEF